VTLKYGLEVIIHTGTIRKLGAVFYSPSIVTTALWYLVSFARYSNLLVENWQIFIPHGPSCI